MPEFIEECSIKNELELLLGNHSSVPNVNDIAIGNYASILSKNPFFSSKEQLLENDIDGFLNLKIKNFLNANENSYQTQFNLLCIGISSLYSFCQICWTGPDLEVGSLDLIPQLKGIVDINKLLLDALVKDNEEVYHLVPHPLYFIIAKSILVDNLSLLDQIVSAKWWKTRTLIIHQKILENPSDSIFQDLFQTLDDASTFLEDNEMKACSSYIELRTRFELEHGLAYQYYKLDKKSLVKFQSSQTTHQFQWKLSGALGKRTKHQSFDVSQLVLLASSHESALEKKVVPNKKPENFDLNCDTLLENIKLTNEDEVVQENLNVLDQCILLAFCLNVKNTNADDGLTGEEMLAFVSRVLQNPNNWMVYSMALLLRSRLECNKAKTIERSVRQFQALVDQFSIKEESTVGERMKYLFALMFPNKWEMERELAEKLISLGCIKSSLDIFTRLEMWEDVVSCYQSLAKPKKAEEIVLELLKTQPDSPKFLCILGDVREDHTLHQKAWEVSGKRYARAMRSLGAYYFKQSDYPNCIESYENALKINPLYEKTWFVLGCAAMHEEQWEKAAGAFARVVSIDHDHGEAWTNLASVYIKMQRKTDAWRALKEALRAMFDNYQIWENYLYTCLDVREFEEAILSFHRIVELRWDKVSQPGKSVVDTEALNILVDAITQNVADSNGNSSLKLLPKLLTLFDFVTSKIVNSPSIYQSYARLQRISLMYKKSLENSLKAYRLWNNHPELTTVTAVFDSAVASCLDLCDAYAELGPLTEKARMAADDEEMVVVCKDWQYQTKLMLRSLIGKTKDSFQDTENHDKLKERLKDL